MKTISGLVALLLVGQLVAAPTSKEDEDLIVTKEFFPLEFVKYKGKHDIVNIHVPLNSLNFGNNESSSESDSKDSNTIENVFFVEADTTPDGKRIDQGLYILKDGKATKLIDNGRDIAASGDDSKSVFFGASDGIYVYKDGSTKKYGSLTDSIIGIAKEKSGEGLYILTEDYEVFNVTDNGNHKEKIDSIVNAKQIVLDYSNNIFFYSDDKQIQVLTSKGIKKITGLPENPSSVTLIKPPFNFDEGVPVIVNNSTYMTYPNGTSERSGIEFKPKAKPTAYSSEAAIIIYCAHDKKIYEYDLLALLLISIIDDMKNYLDDKADVIRLVSTRSKTLTK